MTLFSYGIILKVDEKVVLVRRKHSVEYMDLVRGKYSTLEIAYNFLHLITVEENSRLVSWPFIDLWSSLWNRRKRFNVYQFIKARQLFYDSSIPRMAAGIDMDLLYLNPEWVVPKGRKKHHTESDLVAGLREFTEETGIPHKHLLLTGESELEYFYGTNGKRYGTKYYFATLTSGLGELDLVAMFKPQENEIGNIGLCEYSDLRHFIRPWRTTLLSILYQSRGHLGPLGPSGPDEPGGDKSPEPA